VGEAVVCSFTYKPITFCPYPWLTLPIIFVGHKFMFSGWTAAMQSYNNPKDSSG